MIPADLLSPVISGLSALLGAYVGAKLIRKTEYQKWLRQERGKATEVFLRELQTALDRAFLIDDSLPSEQRGFELAGIELEIRRHADVASLYLSPATRSSLDQYITVIWLCIRFERFGEPAKYIQELKALLTDEMHKHTT